MAIVGYTASNPFGGIKIITWSTLANGDSGKPFVSAMFADKTAQVTGTFGAGGTVLIEGTNDDALAPVAGN